MNNLSLIKEIWKILKPSIEVGDVNDAAETLVNYLIEEDYSPIEIKQMFRGDKEIKEAVQFYLEKPEDGAFFEYYDEDDDDIDTYISYNNYYDEEEEDY
jgi:hypothetical protein